jgi:NitT/TauT family transport system permease protein
MRLLVLRSSVWIAAVLLWAALTETKAVDPLLLASPSDTVHALIDGIGSWILVRALGYTLLRSLAGFLIATLIGVPLGLVLGGFALVNEVLGSFVDGLRSMPATALYPVFLLAFGLGDLSKIAVATFICTWAMAIYSAYGVRASGETRRFLLRLHGAPWSQFLLDGLLFPAMPSIIAGTRTVLSLAWVVTIGVEMIVGTKYGIGQAIFDAQNTFRIPSMYASIVLAALTGIGMNQFFIVAAKWLAPWGQGDGSQM